MALIRPLPDGGGGVAGIERLLGPLDDEAEAGDRAGEEAAGGEQPAVLERLQRFLRVGRWASSCGVSTGLATVPRMAIRIATPSAAPTWRATEFSDVAIAKRGPGTEPTAAPLSVGKLRPAPTPRISMPGSQPPRKSGCTPSVVAK